MSINWANLRIFFIYIVFLFSAVSITAQGYFKPTPDIRKAYEYVTTLRFDQAREKIAYIKAKDPENLLVYHVENYIDFFTIFINEEEEEYERLSVNKDERLRKITQGDKNSPYYLFTKAEINLQWATARLKFGETTKPLLEVYRAYKFLEKNNKKFPDFIENKKSLSIIHALSESIPGAVRFIMRVRGSIEQGTKEIQEVVNFAKENDFMFHDEAYAIFAYILFYQNNQKEQAYELLFNADLDHKKSPLLCFLKANIAQKNGYNESALSILDERPTGPEYFPFPYLDFMKGKFKLYALDQSANKDIGSFLHQFKGRHFIKEAYQKMAWYELAENEDIVAYKKYMELCQERGKALVDEDKQALKESEEKRIPNIDLLRSRLLFDGGYYSEAYKLLARKSHQFTNEDGEQLEFNYRMGRISHELKNYPDAISYYAYALNDKSAQHSYMACNSALQIGLILEDQGEYIMAKSYFKKCLSLSPDDYETSLHQKAESALERILQIK